MFLHGAHYVLIIAFMQLMSISQILHNQRQQVCSKTQRGQFVVR